MRLVMLGRVLTGVASAASGYVEVKLVLAGTAQRAHVRHAARYRRLLDGDAGDDRALQEPSGSAPLGPLQSTTADRVGGFCALFGATVSFDDATRASQDEYLRRSATVHPAGRRRGDPARSAAFVE